VNFPLDIQLKRFTACVIICLCNKWLPQHTSESLFWYTTMQTPDPHLSVDHHWSFYRIIYMIIHKLGWGQHVTSKSSTLSFIEYLDNSSYFFQNRKSGFYIIRILTIYITKMQLHRPDKLSILQYISKWARTTNHPRYSYVLNLHSDLKLQSASTDECHLIC